MRSNVNSESRRRLSEFTVILLHNIDPAWPRAEQGKAWRDIICLETAMRKHERRVVSVPVYDGDLSTVLKSFNPRNHIVLNLCEDLPGEPHSEARVARMMESLRFVYTGSPPGVLALGWNKSRVRSRLAAHKIPIPRGMRAASPDRVIWRHFPAIVKLACEHGSVGITSDSVVLNERELRTQLAKMWACFHQPFLIEEFIDGREYHVSLWGNGRVELLPPVELDFSAFKNSHRKIYTYDAKFRLASAYCRKIKEKLATLPAPAYRKLARVCRAVYRAIGCRDYARIDVRQRAGIFYVLDVNTNPEITPNSSMAYAASRAGYSYGGMGSRLVALAAQRHPAIRNRSRTRIWP